MRGALEPMAGIGAVRIQAQEKKFEIDYDPKVVDLDKVLAALAKAGEPAKLL